LNKLADVKDDEMFEEIFQAGVPSIVIKKYRLPEPEDANKEEGDDVKSVVKSVKSVASAKNSRISLEPPDASTGLKKVHVAECLILMTKMNYHEDASHMIAANFAAAMFDTMNKQLEARDIQIPVQN